MDILLERDGFLDTQNIKILCKNIVLKTKCINDCILYNECGVLEENKINWEYVLRINGDLTGYEVSQNEILISDTIFNKNSMTLFLSELKFQFHNKFPNKKFCFIISYNDKGILRFHTYRISEGIWLSTDLEKYSEAVLYDLE